MFRLQEHCLSNWEGKDCHISKIPNSQNEQTQLISMFYTFPLLNHHVLKFSVKRFRWMELLTTQAASNASTEDVQLAHQTTLHMKVASTANTTTTNLSRKRETWANLRVILRRIPWMTKLMEEKFLLNYNDVPSWLTLPAVQMALCLRVRFKSWYLSPKCVGFCLLYLDFVLLLWMFAWDEKT